MSPEQMKVACDTVIDSFKSMNMPTDKASISLVTPKGFKAPPKFPKGYLLHVKPDGSRISHFPAERVLAWLKANKLVDS